MKVSGVTDGKRAYPRGLHPHTPSPGTGLRCRHLPDQGGLAGGEHRALRPAQRGSLSAVRRPVPYWRRQELVGRQLRSPSGGVVHARRFTEMRAGRSRSTAPQI